VAELLHHVRTLSDIDSQVWYGLKQNRMKDAAYRGLEG
jgi:hypothetical protein